MNTRRFVMAAILAFAALPAVAADKVHRLALQISDDTPDKMNAVLNVAANTARYYTGIGEEVEIHVVAFNAGLNMLRTDGDWSPSRNVSSSSIATGRGPAASWFQS